MNANTSTDFYFFLSGLLRPIIAAELDRKFEEIQSQPTTAKNSDEHLTIKQAAEFLEVSQQTIYQNIKKIPHAKRFGKLYFLRSELEEYLASGKVKSSK